MLPRGGAPGGGLARGSSSQLVSRQRSVVHGARTAAQEGPWALAGARPTCRYALPRALETRGCRAATLTERWAIAIEAYRCTEKQGVRPAAPKRLRGAALSPAA